MKTFTHTAVWTWAVEIPRTEENKPQHTTDDCKGSLICSNASPCGNWLVCSSAVHQHSTGPHGSGLPQRGLGSGNEAVLWLLEIPLSPQRLESGLADRACPHINGLPLPFFLFFFLVLLAPSWALASAAAASSVNERSTVLALTREVLAEAPQLVDAAGNRNGDRASCTIKPWGDVSTVLPFLKPCSPAIEHVWSLRSTQMEYAHLSSASLCCCQCQFPFCRC
jgi:hypothetical protein